MPMELSFEDLVKKKKGLEQSVEIASEVVAATKDVGGTSSSIDELDSLLDKGVNILDKLNRIMENPIVSTFAKKRLGIDLKKIGQEDLDAASSIASKLDGMIAEKETKGPIEHKLEEPKQIEAPKEEEPKKKEMLDLPMREHKGKHFLVAKQKKKGRKAKHGRRKNKIKSKAA